MRAEAQALRTEEEPRAARATLEAARAFVRSTLVEAPREGVLAITVAAPVAPVEAPLRALRKAPSWVFAPSDGLAVAAIGVTREARGHGPARFETVRDACAEMLGEVVSRVADGALALPLRAFVGFAFAVGGARSAPWDAFGDALVMLPRWTYACEGSRASLTLALRTERAIDESLALAELEAIFTAIETARREPRRAAEIVRADHLDATRWTRSIDAIRTAIAHGEARKIVAARRSVITTASDIEPLDVLDRLGQARGPTTRFLVRAGSTTFLGATPEHLFVQRGARIATEALAGSVAADAERAAERLLASAKDREEHAYVVHHIVERLGPLCARIAHPDAPQVRRLPTVLHLRTPIEAELARPTHPIDVVAALHPTPAVGGTPVEPAVRWISGHETERGWYASPIGWVDAHGDAEILVALRCGVIQGGRAWLWAGGGIVEGSDPSAEWDETALKMRPMLRALGAST